MPTTNRRPVTGLRLIRRVSCAVALLWVSGFALGFCAAVIP